MSNPFVKMVSYQVFYTALILSGIFYKYENRTLPYYGLVAYHF